MVEPVHNNQPIVRDTTIIVKPGQTLSEIAIEFDTSVEELKKLNALSDVHNISAGQSLFVKIDEKQRQYNKEMAEAKEKYDRRINAEKQELKKLGLMGKDGDIKDKEAVKRYYVAKDLKEGRLKFVPEEKYLLFFTNPAHYEYTSLDPKVETYGDLKRRYNLKDGVLLNNNRSEMDHYYYDGDLDIKNIGVPTNIPLECCCPK